jgi:ABC-type amino acid transport system permease subunit
MSIVLGLYLAFSLLTSAIMNWYNKRVALVER